MIKDLKEGLDGNGIYLISHVQKGTTSNGKTYLNVQLEDKTGEINAKKWSVSNEDLNIFKVGNVIEVKGDVTSFREKLQLNILSARLLEEKEYDVGSVVRSSNENENDLISKLNYFINSISNKNIKAILEDVILKKYYNRFITFPAAKRVHHDYQRGLLEHTISMAEVADFIASHYSNVNRDYLIGGCLLHDIGKCEELSGCIATEYTFEGELLGHISIGYRIVLDSAKELGIENEEEILVLLHMILSHHGKLEFGSPVFPKTKEAYLLSCIDDMDAKTMVIEKAFNEIDEGETTERIFSFDNRTFIKLK